MKTKHWIATMALLGLALCVSAARAQQPEQQQDPRVNPPVEPLPPLAPSESGEGQPQDTPASAPSPSTDNQPPLMSARLRGLGALFGGRNLVLPRLHLYQGGDTNARLSNAPGTQPEAVSVIGGYLDIQHLAARQEFLLNYAGGGDIHSENSHLNGAYHGMGILWQSQGTRWGWMVSDHVSYATGSGGAFGGLSGLPGQSGASGSNTQLDRFLTPSQSIISGLAPRLSNTVVGELQYFANARSALTFTTSYALLHFLESGHIDGNTSSARLGYSYNFRKQDSVGLHYGVSLLRFDQTNQRMINHTAFLSYGKLITEKLAFQVAAGPQISQFEHALSGSTSFVSWSMQTSLVQKYARGDWHLSYLHGMTGGSGVFLGAQTDEARTGISQELSRLWKGGWDLGFAHNVRLRQTSLATAGSYFNTWYARAHVSRRLGRHTGVSFQYGAQRQTTNISNADVHLRHTFGIGLDLSYRPVED